VGSSVDSIPNLLLFPCISFFCMLFKRLFRGNAPAVFFPPGASLFCSSYRSFFSFAAALPLDKGEESVDLTPHSNNCFFPSNAFVVFFLGLKTVRKICFLAFLVSSFLERCSSLLRADIKALYCGSQWSFYSTFLPLSKFMFIFDRQYMDPFHIAGRASSPKVLLGGLSLH